MGGVVTVISNTCVRSCGVLVYVFKIQENLPILGASGHRFCTAKCMRPPGRNSSLKEQSGLSRAFAFCLMPKLLCAPPPGSRAFLGSSLWQNIVERQSMSAHLSVTTDRMAVGVCVIALIQTVNPADWPSRAVIPISRMILLVDSIRPAQRATALRLYSPERQGLPLLLEQMPYRLRVPKHPRVC